LIKVATITLFPMMLSSYQEWPSIQKGNCRIT
jgi:hypothetical protein